MSDLWSVAITEADWKWLENSVSTHLANALGAVHSPDTNGGMVPLPLYTHELEWLVSRVGLEPDWNPGLIFALNTAVPAPYPVRMTREWSDRNEENRKENAARRQYVEQYSAGTERVTEVQDMTVINIPPVPEELLRWRRNLMEGWEDTNLFDEEVGYAEPIE